MKAHRSAIFCHAGVRTGFRHFAEVRHYMQQEVRQTGCETKPGEASVMGGIPIDQNGNFSMRDHPDSTARNTQGENAGCQSRSCGCFEKSGCRRESPGKVSPAAKCLMLLIRIYRICISPLIPPCCRFIPTCSEYGLEALRVHGAVKGSLLTIWRVLRCNPFCRSGYDPVPPRKTKSRK